MGSLEKLANMKTALILITCLVALAITEPQKPLTGFDDGLVDIAGGSCLFCIGEVSSAVFDCIKKPGSIKQKALCAVSKVSSDCRGCLCSFVCKLPNPIARAMCTFLRTAGLCN